MSVLQSQKVIVFQLGEEEYGVGVEQVKSIERVQTVTRVPNTASFIKGVINLRGVVTPILDLRMRFNIQEREYNNQTRVIIVTVDDMEVGLIVDAANDVMDINQDNIEPPPEVVGGIEADYLNGVAKLEKRLLILLNLNKVLSKAELEELKTIEAKS
ncbi:chemotaxis protein CheW [Alteribacter aurantiacus]|uniref:chemotaxis protein CheW n=1 Tax=Alteribacter aurantiacus TaxID=254410 RepID=UPI0003FF2AD0|nr:chemotaxis protein CheW [Alteribacter aurantiacus]